MICDRCVTDSGIKHSYIDIVIICTTVIGNKIINFFKSENKLISNNYHTLIIICAAVPDDIYLFNILKFK